MKSRRVEKTVDKTSDERNKTAKSARQMAVVIVPDALTKPDAVAPDEILVVLHFHGWTFRSWDPYAGYRIGKDKGGTVRDVDQEHLEQQIGAFSKSNKVTVVGILAQGVGKSDFYDKGTIPTFEYIRDVLLKSKVPALEKIAKGEKYSVVLSAHSGGGSNQVIPMMANKEAETADRSRLAPQKAGKDGRVVDRLQPVKLIPLVEALNGDTDVNLVMAWVNRQLDRLVPVLKAATSPSDAKAASEFAATPKLQGYFGHRDFGVCDAIQGLERPDLQGDRRSGAGGVADRGGGPVPHHRGQRPRSEWEEGGRARTGNQRDRHGPESRNLRRRTKRLA